MNITFDFETASIQMKCKKNTKNAFHNNSTQNTMHHDHDILTIETHYRS